MFLWVTCRGGVNTQDLLPEAMASKVLFVPGRDFFPNGAGERFMRLNFSNAKPDQIRAGVSRLAAVCGSAIQPVVG